MGVTQEGELTTETGLTGTSEIDRLFSTITWHVLPVVTWMYILAFVDRVNVGFAKLQMLSDLHFSNAVFGLGAGVFFIGYALFEVPSNLYLGRVGVRKTLSRIMILWGLASFAGMFVVTPAQFYAARFFLGTFEAGLFPGVIIYLSRWYPSDRRCLIISLFIAALPISSVLGAPLSGFIMDRMGGIGGLANWQWLFLIEGLPTVVTGLLVYFYFVEGPEVASWLSRSQKLKLSAMLAEDRRINPPAHARFALCLKRPLIWHLSAVNFCLVFAVTGITFWTPTILKGVGVSSSLDIGYIASAIALFAAVSMASAGWNSDRTEDRRLHTAGCLIVGAIGLVLLSFVPHAQLLAIAALALATAATFGVLGVFWEIPTAMLIGTAAAGGVALVNSIGVTAGFFAQYLTGLILTETGEISWALLMIAAVEFLGAFLALALVLHRRA